MGFVFSKPVNYVKTKVQNVTQAVSTKVTDTKTAIVTKISNTKTAVVTTVDNTKNGLVQRVTNVKNGVKSKCDGVVATVKRGGQAVGNKCTEVKDGITGRYTRTKNKVHGTYTRIRDTKLTRWQKFKYSLLAFVSIISLIIITSISVDLYQGNQEAAQAKIDTVCELFHFLLSYLQYFGENLYKGGRIGGKFAWKIALAGGSHLWDATQVVSVYAWEGTKVGAKYAWAGASSAGVLLANGALVVGENTMYYSKIGAENFVEGSKVAADYGWYGVSVGSIKAYEGSKLLAQNAAVWAQEGSVYAWETSKTLAVGLATGSVSLSQVIMDVSTFMADKAYWTSLFIADYSKWFAVGTWNLICSVSLFTGNWTVIIAQGLYDGTISLSAFIWDFLTSFSVWLYRFSISLVDMIATKSITSTRFLWSWTQYIATEGSKGLYVGFNKIGVRGFIALTKKLGEWSWILGEIMWKFVNDLVIYTGNFLYVLSVHIYNILYIVIAFIMQIVMGVMGIIKLIISGLVAIVTFVFGGIIWLLEEFSGAYMFALHKYNMYREFLFIGFLGLMVFYCMGVMRDRRISSEEEVDGLESSDEDEQIGLPDEIDADEELTGVKKTPPVQKIVRTPSGRLKNLPPIYEERKKLQPYTKAYASSESSDDLGLGSDQDVPDALNSSLDSDGMLSGDERELRIQNVSRRQRNAQSSPRREAAQPGQSPPKSQSPPMSPQRGNLSGSSPQPVSPSASPTTPCVTDGQLSGPGSPSSRARPAEGTPANKAQVTMTSASTTSTNVHFVAPKSEDSVPKPGVQAVSPVAAQPEPVKQPKPISPSSQQIQELKPGAPLGQQGKDLKPAVQPASPKPAVQPESAKPAVQPASPKPAVQPASPKPAVQPASPKPAVQPASPKPAVQPASPQPRLLTDQTDKSKPSASSPVQQNRSDPTKQVETDMKKTGAITSTQDVQSATKTSPAADAKPKSALHEKLVQFDASKSKQVSSPPKTVEQVPSETDVSANSSKTLSTSPRGSKFSKPSSPPSSGFMSPARRQAAKVLPVGSPTELRTGSSKSKTSESKTSEAPPKSSAADPPKSRNVAQSPAKPIAPNSPSAAATAPKPIPGSPSKPNSSPTVSPPSKTATGAAAGDDSSPSSPPGKNGGSIRMLQQRLSQGSADTKTGGVRVRVADFSTSPKKS